MSRVVSLYRSSVGKKSLMAVSGILLIGFVFGHMVGNLKAFESVGESGVHPLDSYAQFLREVGYPLIPETGLLWGVRLALLAAVGVHIVAAYQLWRQSRSARTQRYHKPDSQVFSYASRTMRWGGVIIVLFVIYHLLHFTTGDVHPDFEYGSVYQNLVIGFQSIPVALFYIVAVGALSLHLYHGIWSVFATLGVQNPRVERLRRPLAAGLSLVLFVGYVSVPIAVMIGFLD
ncbi:MAG: succinate dehydrogenase [Gemmatimonadales bacterium]|nr:MAG: succinate dehydrogenase [Gemmatimonadales bacterium]